MIDVQAGLDSLAAAIADERAETVRVVFADHYGVLRGRRLAAERFLDSARSAQAFCDGALVWDIRCEIFEGASFSNYGTGYPDLHAYPDLSTLRPCGWCEDEWVVIGDPRSAHGDPISVDPRNVLREVVARVEREVRVALKLDLRVPDDAITASWAPGHTPALARHLIDGLRATGLAVESLEWHRPSRLMRVALGASEPIEAADALVLARTAARELAARHQARLTAMPRIRTDEPAASLSLVAELGDAHADGALVGRLADVALLLNPLPPAQGGDPSATVGADGRLHVRASSDANPYLAIAGLLAAATDRRDAPAASSETMTYRHAIDRLAGASWLEDWLDARFMLDALALARREAVLREGALTEWDLDRYWESG